MRPEEDRAKPEFEMREREGNKRGLSCHFMPLEFDSTRPEFDRKGLGWIRLVDNYLRMSGLKI